MKLRNNSAFIKRFGNCKMNSNHLPTYIDIARHYLCIIDLNKNVAFKEILKTVKQIWNRSSIPVISDKGIKIKFDRYMVHINTLRKKSSRIIFEDLINTHFIKYDVLFDIASCNCKVIENCRCTNANRVPVAERTFLVDQRSSRKMIIDVSTEATTFQSRSIQPSTSSAIQLVNVIYLILLYFVI